FTIGLLLTGKRIPTRQRWTASLFLIGAAMVFLCPNWRALMRFSTSERVFEAADIDLIQPLGVKVLIATTLIVLVANILIDRAMRLPSERRARLLIFCSVLVNLTFLGFFKYFNF